MSMPVFTPGEDPGSSFADLLRRIGASGADVDGDAAALGALPHATTCVAARYADGVVMAGDRRATAGNLISHRSMDKVIEADRHSAVAIAGAAGPAMEMVRLFQLQLEHYEKVEGTALSLEGKANQLSMMIRGNLQAAMMGLAVVPIFGGYDLRRQVGRLFAYDVTGGRYEEQEYVATGSGSLHAGTVIKVGYRPAMDRADAVDLVCRALWEAADADSATGGPDMLRGIFPIVATITADGFTASRTTSWRSATKRSPTTSEPGRLERHEHAVHCVPRPRRPRSRHEPLRSLALASTSLIGGARLMNMPFYVAPEQVMKDRADYARKGIARGRALVAVRYADGIAIVAENSSETLRKISEIYDRIAFAGVGRYNEFDQLRVAGVRAADLKGYQYSRDDVDARSLANQYAQILGQIFTHEMKPMEVEILVAEVGLRAGRRPDVPHPLRRHGVRPARPHRARWRRRRDPRPRIGESYADGLDAGGAVRAGAAALAGPDRELPAGDLEVALLARGATAALLPPPHRRTGRRLPRLARRRHRV